MPKRKSTVDSAEDATPRRSLRPRSSTSTTASAPPPAPASAPKAAQADKKSKTTAAKAKPVKAKAGARSAEADNDSAAPRPNPKGSALEPPHAKADTDTVNGATGQQYWLMRAEPETRYENGVDVSFSIDDLAGKTEPEPWDGSSCSLPLHSLPYEIYSGTCTNADGMGKLGIRNYAGM